MAKAKVKPQKPPFRKVRDIVIKVTVVDADYAYGIDPANIIEAIEGGADDHWFAGSEILDPGKPRDPTEAEIATLEAPPFIGYATCQNCCAGWSTDRLNPIKDVMQRVAAGEIMPAGECPTCGALCHLITQTANEE